MTMPNKEYTHEDYAREYWAHKDRIRKSVEGFRQELESMKTKLKKIYVAGPMTGLVNCNFPAFYKAAAMLSLWGYNPINPAAMDIDAQVASFNHNTKSVIMDNSFTMEDALGRDYDVIRDCAAVVVLPNWQQSKGANREIVYALSRGIPVFEYNENDPLDIERTEPMRLVATVNCTVEESNGS
jgi:hypothetical protein